MSAALILILAALLDAALGEPRLLWDRAPHPAVLMGRLIGWADQQFNRGSARKLRGSLVLLALLILAATLGRLIEALPTRIPDILVLAALLAQKSLADHVAAVAAGLRMSLGEGRRAVALIVGRDTSGIDAAAVSRGAIESAAENLSDGVIAPAFWFLIAGLPGLLAYKFVNTADSMIGYRTPRHEEFGWAAARFDDVINWIPARLTAALIAGAHFLPEAWAVIRRDAPLHRSPNAGWPEAAMAAVLGIALSGPRSYEGERRDFPWVNPAGDRNPGAKDIDAAVSTLWRAWALGLVLAAVFTLV
jgi:adenosylcobinamide-phosphate synthase